MKVAYADNDMERLKRIESYLRDYCRQKNEDFSIDSFTNPYELVEKFKTEVYDFFIVTAIYPEQKVSGLEISNKARVHSPFIPALFLEPKDNGDTQICFVYPRRYQLKPLSELSFNSIMDKLYLQIFDAPLGSINVINAFNKHNEKINISEIVYAESTKKIVSIYLYSGNCIHINGPIKNFVEKLSFFSEFLFPHKSFVVNSIFISKITDNRIFLKNSDVQIPIARGKIQFVQENYRKFLKKFILENAVTDHRNIGSIPTFCYQNDIEE